MTVDITLTLEVLIVEQLPSLLRWRLARMDFRAIHIEKVLDANTPGIEK
jgi:hypothetical protein